MRRPLYVSRGAALSALTAGLLACSADSNLDDSFAERDPLYARATTIVPMSTVNGESCPPSMLRATTGDQDFCINENFCVDRSGDFCGLAPQEVNDGSDDVQIWSDVIMWCYQPGPLAVNERGELRILDDGGELVEPPRSDLPLLRTSGAGCVSNPAGHGLRDDTCRTEGEALDASAAQAQNETTEQVISFATCTPAGEFPGLESAVLCHRTTLYDHRGLVELGERAEATSGVFEALSREYCDGACSDGACEVPELWIEKPESAACPSGYEQASYVPNPEGANQFYADENPIREVCVRQSACAETVSQFCTAAPEGVQTVAQWRASSDREDLVAGMPIIAGTELLSCWRGADGSGSPAIYECPSLYGVPGQCLVSIMGSGCSDQTLSALNPALTYESDEEPEERKVACSRRAPFYGYELTAAWTWMYDALTSEMVHLLAVESIAANEECDDIVATEAECLAVSRQACSLTGRSAVDACWEVAQTICSTHE